MKDLQNIWMHFTYKPETASGWYEDALNYKFRNSIPIDEDFERSNWTTLDINLQVVQWLLVRIHYGRVQTPIIFLHS